MIDLDATLLTAHSEKQDATRTWKKTFGHHRLLGFADHGTGGGGEPVAELLRPGKAGSNTVVDHVAVFDAALAQLPEPLRRRDEQGRVAVLVRTDWVNSSTPTSPPPTRKPPSRRPTSPHPPRRQHRHPDHRTQQDPHPTAGQPDQSRRQTRPPPPTSGGLGHDRCPVGRHRRISLRRHESCPGMPHQSG